MAKYTDASVRDIPGNEIAKELLTAQQENIARPNPDVPKISNEISRRLTRSGLQLIGDGMKKLLGLSNNYP